MLDGLKESLMYIEGLVKKGDTPQVIEICGKTYCNKDLKEYGGVRYANAIKATSLSSLIDYIGQLPEEFATDRMLIQIVSPTRVELVSTLNEDRKRECLFISEANVSEFKFDHWYDQERFLIELQANFEDTTDRDVMQAFAGNVIKKNDVTFSDDGITQVATMHVGAASKDNVIVPNPVVLKPYRTFQEVEQPESAFVFRMNGADAPGFKIVEADNHMWMNAAVLDIKEYLVESLKEMSAPIRDRILIIG